MFRFRPAPLTAAAVLAAGFVLLRVGYRALFNGLDGTGLLLLDLPAVPLPPPFGHVVMFGPITTGGVWTAILSAVPIALTILAFGVLNALVDVSRLFARGARRGPLRGIARALVIAWATFPALTDTVASVRTARRLRAERGAASLLVPLLERTVERSIAVAATMEVRGFAGRPVDGACDRPVVLQGVSLGFGRRRMLTAVDLELGTGSLTVIAGPTGSGKTSLLHAMSGLFTHVDGGRIDGRIEIGGIDRLRVPPRDTAGFIGVVLQQPRLGFASESVADEIGFSLSVRGVAPVIVAARVAEVANRVGVAHLVGRDIRALSAGEATLVAIAAAIIERPTLLLVDEPLADLDSQARVRIVTLLGALAHEAGVCVVVAEHRIDELAGVADAVVEISDGRLRAAGSSTPSGAGIGDPVVAPGSGSPVAVLSGVSVERSGRPAVIDASFAVEAGEIVAITGWNGAGKSTLLRAIALPDAAGPGSIVVDGVDVASLSARERRGAVALVPDESDDLLFSTTVARECLRADRSAGLVDGATLGLFLSLASGAGREAEAAPDGPAAEFGRRHPRDLSTGERRLLAIAIQSAAQPQLLLVDEPTRGLDGAARRLVASALRAAAWSGSAVVIATHDRAFAAGLASRALTMSAGRLTAADAPSVAGNRSSAIADGPGGPASGSAIAGTSSAPSVPSPAPAIPAPVVPAPPERPTARRFGTWQAWLLLGGSLLAAASFCWPLLVPALPAQAQAAAPFAAIALLPLVLIAVALGLDGEVRSAATLALLGTLTAIGAAVRVVGTGVGGVEAVFVLLILAGRAFGARFGFLLGVLTIALSSTMWGGFGPWTPFQMFACGWVGAGAGLLPRTRSTAAEIVMLSAYGVVASYVFGLAMNLWFWPFAVGTASEIAYAPGAPLARNAGSFLLYSLVTSTITWDTLRAITSVVGVVVAGPAVLAALRRAKLAAPVRRPRGTRTPGSQTPRPRSTSPRGGGTRTRRSTAPDEAAAPPTGPPPSVPA